MSKRVLGCVINSVAALSIIERVRLILTAFVLSLTLFGSATLAQASQLFPDWFTESDAPTWTTSTIELDANEKNNLEIIARRELGRTCTLYEGLRWNLADPDSFSGSPISELYFYSLLEEQYGGVRFVDVNLNSIYGVTNDNRVVFCWGAPWGLWQFDGIYVYFLACQTAPR